MTVCQISDALGANLSRAVFDQKLAGCQPGNTLYILGGYATVYYAATACNISKTILLRSGDYLVREFSGVKTIPKE